MDLGGLVCMQRCSRMGGLARTGKTAAPEARPSQQPNKLWLLCTSLVAVQLFPRTTMPRLARRPTHRQQGLGPASNIASQQQTKHPIVLLELA